MGMVFENREEAGRRLAAALPQFHEQPDTVLLGLARGGIPVASAAAEVLHLPYGTVLVRKLGIPGHDETAFGALAIRLKGWDPPRRTPTPRDRRRPPRRPAG